jgi:hypothetical protein
MGVLLSLATLGDCSFVWLDPGIEVSETDSVVIRLGFATFQRPNGACYWYEYADNPNDQVEEYFDFLGSDWRLARIFGAVAGCGGLLYFLFSLSLCCSSHLRAIRLFSAFFLCVALTLFQLMTFLVFTSDICSDSKCELSRSAGWSIGAASCYFTSGLLHLFMENYPGRDRVEEMQGQLKQPCPMSVASDRDDGAANFSVEDDAFGASVHIENQTVKSALTDDPSEVDTVKTKGGPKEDP